VSPLFFPLISHIWRAVFTGGFSVPLCFCRQPAAEKPCCTGKKKTGDSEQTDTPAPQQKQKQPAGLSTFEFGG
jgi:hypothetical protein